MMLNICKKLNKFGASTVRPYLKDCLSIDFKDSGIGMAKDLNKDSFTWKDASTRVSCGMFLIGRSLTSN